MRTERPEVATEMPTCQLLSIIPNLRSQSVSIPAEVPTIIHVRLRSMQMQVIGPYCRGFSSLCRTHIVRRSSMTILECVVASIKFDAESDFAPRMTVAPTHGLMLLTRIVMHYTRHILSRIICPIFTHKLKFTVLW